MQKLLLASLVCVLCATGLMSQENFEGTLHYTHTIRFEDNDAFKAHRKKLKERANTVAHPQIASLQSGEMEHRRAYTVQPDKLVSTVRDIDGKKILEYRVQEPDYAFRVDHASQTITNPMLIVEKRENAKAPKYKGKEIVNGFDCTVYTVKYKGGELTLWVTDAIAMPTYVGYFSEILLNRKVIVQSIDHNRTEGRYEECKLAHIDYEKQVISKEDLLALECLYKDSRTIERRMLVQNAGLRGKAKD